MAPSSSPLIETKLIRSLIQAWEALGATSFEVQHYERTIVHWASASHTISTPSLYTTIQHQNQVLGEIHVSGVSGEDAQIRLQTDAILLAHILGQETEFDELATEFISVQDQLVTLCELLRSIRLYLSVQEAYNALAHAAMQFTKADGVFITFSSATEQADIVQTDTMLLDEQVIADLTAPIYMNGQEYLAHKEDSSLLQETDIDSSLLIPVPIRRTVIAGCLGLINAPDGFTTPGIKLVRIVAEQVGILVERELLHQDIISRIRMQTEMDLARKVQKRLLPSTTPTLPLLDIHARLHPAYEVGGDFYDFIHQTDESFFFTLGDIAGKGMPAALMAATARTVIRNKITFVPHPSPLMVIERSSEDLYRDLVEVGMFVTMFVGQYIPQERRLNYTNAGHSPVIYCPAHGKACLLEADGIPLGIQQNLLCEQQTLKIDTGDVLVIATDGFNEAQDAHENLFGYDRLLELIETHADLSAADMVNLLFNEIATFRGKQPQYDDQTVIVIKGV